MNIKQQEVEELTEHKNLLEHDLHDISECVDEIQKEKAQAEKERDAVIKKTEVLEKRFSALNSKSKKVRRDVQIERGDKGSRRNQIYV